MREQIANLRAHTFGGLTKKELEEETDRLRRIRELSADYLTALKTDLECDTFRLQGGCMSEEKSASITLPGTVEKIIKPLLPEESEKAQISVEGADDLYKEIRFENSLKDKDGETVQLKKGAHVEVTVVENKK